MNLLNENNVVHIFFDKVGDIIFANLLFILCSIPIITIGPSLTALYHCMLRTVKGNNNGTVKTFFRAFRQNFRQSVIVWAVFLAVGGMLAVNIHFLVQMSSTLSLALLFFSYGLVILLFFWFLYIFPVIAALSGSLLQLVKNAFLFIYMHFPSTLAIAVISAVPMWMTFWDTRLLPLYAFCWFFFGFGLTAFLNSFFFYRIFRPYLDESSSQTP